MKLIDVMNTLFLNQRVRIVKLDRETETVTKEYFKGHVLKLATAPYEYLHDATVKNVFIEDDTLTIGIE